MKRQLPLALVFLGVVLLFPALGQAQDPVARAAREEAAENYRTLAARVSQLEAEIRSYEGRIIRLADDVHKLRDELDRQKNRNENAATLERINRLQEAIKQVDEARQEDNKKVLSEMARLRTLLEKTAKAMASPAPPPVDRTERPERPERRPTPEPGTKTPPNSGYEYTIQKGDTLLGIINALKAEGYKVSKKQMEDANPGVKWDKLAIGRKIFIPPPSQ